MQPKNTDEPKVIKRCRVRPRKNELRSTTIQIPPIVSNSPPENKQIRSNQGSSVLKKQRAKKLKNDGIKFRI